MTSSNLKLFVATLALLEISFKFGECQVYSWTDQPGDIYIQQCNSAQLNFTWTYEPASPDPLAIQWTKKKAGGSFTNVATFGGGIFNPNSAYTGRVVRLANTAELGLKNPTSADDGTYRVSVTDSNGVPIISEDVVVSSVVTAETSGITAICGEDEKTVTCAGVTTLGMPGATITLSFGSSSKDNGGIQTTVSEVMASREAVTCLLSGPSTECLGAGVTKNSSIECGPCDCSDLLRVIIIIIIVIKVFAFIILLIAIACLKKKLKVIQVLYIADVILAIPAIIGGIVCIAVTVTEMISCEGSICNTSLGLSITALVIGLVNLLFIIFVFGFVMDKADINNKPLAGHFCAFPRKNVDKPRRGENSPTNATVVDIGVTNSGNSRGNGNHGKVPPKSKTTNGPKASSLGTHERKNEDKVDNTNIRGLSLQPILSNEKGDGHNGQTNNNTNSKLETDNGEKKKGSKKKKKTKKKLSAENGDGSRSPPTVSVSAVDVDDQKTAGKPEEQTGSLSKLTVVESSE